jgi:predicted GNAT family N-acyltransferase
VSLCVFGAFILIAWNKFDYLIGRVTVSPKYRDRKWGHELMRESIAGIALHFESNITIELLSEKFYESHVCANKKCI